MEKSKFTSMNIPNNASKKPSLKSNIKKLFKRPIFTREKTLFFIIFLLIGALFFSLYLYKQEKEKSENTSQIVAEEARKVKEKVGKLILLTEEEEPTIATVVNIETLKKENPEFYKNAQNGDKLVVYTTRAIIYRPSTDMLINVAPVIKSPEDNQTTSTTTTTSSSE